MWLSSIALVCRTCETISQSGELWWPVRSYIWLGSSRRPGITCNGSSVCRRDRFSDLVLHICVQLGNCSLCNEPTSGDCVAWLTLIEQLPEAFVINNTVRAQVSLHRLSPLTRDPGGVDRTTTARPRPQGKWVVLLADALDEGAHLLFIRGWLHGSSPGWFTEERKSQGVLFIFLSILLIRCRISLRAQAFPYKYKVDPINVFDGILTDPLDDVLFTLCVSSPWQQPCAQLHEEMMVSLWCRGSGPQSVNICWTDVRAACSWTWRHSHMFHWHTCVEDHHKVTWWRLRTVRTWACEELTLSNSSYPEVTKNWDGLGKEVTSCWDKCLHKITQTVQHNRPNMSTVFRTSSLRHFLSLVSAVNLPACCCSQRPATVSPLWLFWVGGRERTTRVFIYICIKRPRLSFLLNMVKCSWNSFLRDLKMLCSSSTLLHTDNVSFTFLLVVSIMSNWWFCSCTCTKDQMFHQFVCKTKENQSHDSSEVGGRMFIEH